MTPIVVPGYAAVFAIIYVVLAVRVTMLRQRRKVGIGSGGHADLERAARVHANFGEYVPFALLLLAFMEMQRQSIFLIHALALLLLVGRIVHAYGVSQQDEDLRIRGAGIAATWIVLVVAAVVLLLNAVRAAAI
jgi:uncharacterized membrane protein YecN with MAPEG domain